MDAIELGATVVGHLLGASKCRYCTKICDGEGWVNQAWITPCCKMRLCDSCVNHWAYEVQTNRGRCPKCGKAVG
jgi:hypothetical protein